MQSTAAGKGSSCKFPSKSAKNEKLRQRYIGCHLPFQQRSPHLFFSACYRRKNAPRQISFEESVTMDRRNTQSKLSFREGDASDAGVGEGRGSSVPDNNVNSAGSLRSVVERQFMRMNEAHDRHRTQILASYSPNMK